MSAGKSLKHVGTASHLSDHRAGSRRTSLSGRKGVGTAAPAIKATEDRVLQPAHDCERV